MTSADEVPATGVWLVGARGSVAVTAIVGAAALCAGLVEPVGCVTAGPEFAGARLPDYADLVFGGHDVSDVSILKQAAELAADGVIPAALPSAVADELRAADAAIRPALPRAGDPRPARQRISGLIADIEAFRAERRLRRVVVVNVASTEPPIPDPDHPAHRRLADLETALDRDEAGLPPSSEYAYAALRAGCPYVDFTPSTGARLPALDELARSVGVPYAGSDGKTGETLLKSVLAPMFTSRALRVRSWSGTNLLGGGDGATLADAGAAASKTISQASWTGPDARLPRSRAAPTSTTSPALGDWKTAWDHVTFEGFLGIRMTHAVHLAGLRFGAGRAAGPGPGAAAGRGHAAGSAGALARARRSSSRTRSAADGQGEPDTASRASTRRCSLGLACGDRPLMPDVRALTELVRAPAALQRARRRPGRSRRGRAPDRRAHLRPGRRLGVPVLGRHGAQRLRRPGSRRRRTPRAADPLRPRRPGTALALAGRPHRGRARPRRRWPAGVERWPSPCRWPARLGLRPGARRTVRPVRPRWPPAAGWTCCWAPVPAPVRRGGAAGGAPSPRHT